MASGSHTTILCPFQDNFSLVMSFRKALASTTPVLLAGGQIIQAISLDLSSTGTRLPQFLPSFRMVTGLNKLPDSIMSVARIIAFDMMSCYTENTSGGIPGNFPNQ